MDRAVDKGFFRIKRSKAILILLAAGGLAVVVSALAFERGPYICTNGCGVASPVPDALTLQFIKDSRAPVDYVPLFAWASGTTYQICNGSHCTVYHENFESNWIGEGRVQREGVPPSSGGGLGSGSGNPGGGGQGGGNGGGGGGDGGGGGTVVVGPPTQEN